MAEPRFRFNATANRYVDRRTGRFVRREQVRGALDHAWDQQATRARSLSSRLREGAISLAQWEMGMRRIVKDAQLYGAVAARGGWAQMSQADYGRVGAEVKKQYRYLHTFAREIASGRQLLDGTVEVRATLYAQAGRHTFHLVERQQMVAHGFTEERNVLDPAAEHCQDCEKQSARGWVPIGTLVPVGERRCNMNDRCRIEYR